MNSQNRLIHYSRKPLRGPYKRRTVEERFEVSRYVPEENALEAARERTQDLLMTFYYEGARYDSLQALVESCYLQGVTDAAQALFLTGYEIVKKSPAQKA